TTADALRVNAACPNAAREPCATPSTGRPWSRCAAGPHGVPSTSAGSIVGAPKRRPHDPRAPAAHGYLPSAADWHLLRSRTHLPCPASGAALTAAYELLLMRRLRESQPNVRSTIYIFSCLPDL